MHVLGTGKFGGPDRIMSTMETYLNLYTIIETPQSSHLKSVCNVIFKTYCNNNNSNNNKNNNDIE